MNVTNANQAVWEMTQLIIAPKKVFRNIYYHVSPIQVSLYSLMKTADNIDRNVRCKTWHHDSN